MQTGLSCLIRWVSVSLVLICKPALTFAASIDPTELKLVITAENLKDFTELGGATLTAKSTLESFGRQFKVAGGPFGMGPFNDVSVVDRRPTAGARGLWHLSIKGSATFTTVTMYDMSAQAPRVEAKFVLTVTDKILPALKDEYAGSLIVWRILKEMPFMGVVLKDKLLRENQVEGKPSGLATKLAPSDLMLFSLNVSDQSTLLVDVIGFGKMVEKSQENVRWATTRKSEDLPSGMTAILIHDLKGRGAGLAEVETQLTEALRPFAASFESLASTAYVGIRYGAPLQTTDPRLKAAPLGLFFESRQGILNGFRISHDRAPTAKLTTATYESVFSWSRTQIGYGWGRSLSLPIINWFDVMPKIGLTNYSVEKKVLAGLERPYSFKLSNAIATGIEAGLENRSFSFLLRGWLLFNYAVLTQVSQKTSIDQLRYGVDVYRDLFTLGEDYRLTGLVYVSKESTKLSRSADPSVRGVETVTGLKYSNLFIGGGITVAW